MGKKHHHVRVLMHRSFAVFLTVFLISDVGRVYASSNLQIIAQQKESSQLNATEAEALKLMQEGLQLQKQGSKESLLIARNKFEAALVLWKKLGDKKLQAVTLNYIGGVYDSLGEKQKAIQYFNQALPTNKFSGNSPKTIKVNSLALHISERSRARGLIELLAQANATLSKNVNPKFIAEEKELQLKRQAQEKILVKLINQKQPAKDTIKQTEAEIQNIINQQKQLKAKIRAQNPERDKLTNPEPLKLPQIQQQLDKDTVFLQYSLGEERSYLWLVTPTSLNSYELPSGEEIEKVAKEFHSELATNNLPIDSAQKLSKMILAPVQDKLAGKRLVIVADGVLQQIPFAALADPNNSKNSTSIKTSNECRDVTCNVSRGGIIPQPKPGVNINNTNYQPLMLNHEIVNLPSASTIAIQREKIAKRKIAPKKIAILADPVYSSNDERIIGKSSSYDLDIDINTQLERSALKRFAKSLNREGWSQLPNTLIEAQEILKLVLSSVSLQAFSFDANYKWATSKDLNQYQILHFATHGFVNPDQPELSGIVLSLVNKDRQQIPGYLRLADLFEQDYPAELIVLSACQTGLGKDVSGEGVVGLTRGLMYAGAARVALSLWNVSDEGTSVLMQEFYKQMLQENKTPTQALRAAQRKLWANPDWRNPYYWAAFTLQGEWN